MSLHTSLRTLARTYSRGDHLVSDVELLARFAERRDDESFRGLVERHGPMVKAVCRRTSGDDHAAEDAFQAAFLTLARQAGRIRRPEALPGWLYKVAHSCGLKARRKYPTLPANERRDSSADPLDRISGRELLEIVDAELVRLPEAHRSALIVCTIEGLTVEEAARRLKATTGAVRGWLERGREMLRKRLAARKIELSAVLVTLSAASSCRLTASQIESAVAILKQGSRLIPSVLSSLTTNRVPATWTAITATVFAGVIGGAILAEHKKEPIPPPTDMREIVAEPIPKTKNDEPPLPEGAVARIGSTKMRTQSSSKWLEFERDGNSLLAMSYDANEIKGDISVWNLASGRKDRSFRYGQIQEGAFLLPDGKLMLSFVVDDGRNPELGCPISLPKIDDEHSEIVAHRIEIATGKIIASARLAKPATSFLHRNSSISPDGTLLAVAYQEGENTLRNGVCLISTENGKIIKRIDDWHREPFYVSSMTFLPNSKQIALVVADLKNLNQSSIHIHDAKTGRHVKSYDNIGRHVGQIAFSSNGERMAYQAYSQNGVETMVHDLKAGREIMKSIYRRMNNPGAVLLTPDGQTVVSSMQYATIVYDVANGDVRHHFPPMASPTLSADGLWLAGSQWGTIGVWNLKTGAQLNQSAIPFDSSTKPRFTKSGTFRVLGDLITERDLKTGKQTERAWPCRGPRNGAQDEISDDGSFAAIQWDTRDRKKETAGDVRIRFLNVEKNAFVSECEFKTMRTFGTCFSADTRYYFVSHGDDVRLKKAFVQRVDVKTGQIDRTYEGDNDAMYVLNVSSDGRYLAGANPYAKDDGVDNVRIWDVDSGKLLHEISLKSAVTEFRTRRGLLVDGTRYHIGNLTFLSDGQMVAEIAADQDLVFLDPQSGKELNRLPFDGRRIDHYTFDHEGKKLYFREHRQGDKETEYTIKVRDLKSGRETTLIKGPHANNGVPLVLSLDGKWLGTQSENGLCYLWDVSKLKNPKPNQE